MSDTSLHDVMASQLGWDMDATQFGDRVPSEAEQNAEPPAAVDASQARGSGPRREVPLMEAIVGRLNGAGVDVSRDMRGETWTSSSRPGDY